jgi:hypothetical protein
MCWEGSVAHHCCQCVNDSQLLIIKLRCALPSTGLQCRSSWCSGKSGVVSCKAAGGWGFG